MEELYKRIKERRTALGMSQEELARKAGYTNSMGEPAEVYVHEDRIEKRNYCSECGKLGDDIWLNYCPNCGAKMFAKDTNVSNKKGAGDE